MQLASSDGTRLHLSVEAYEFPDHQARGPDDHDANWLNIRIDATTAQGAHWTTVDPCMTTWEVAELAEWLSGLAANTPVRDRIEFIEPNLWFEVREHDEGYRSLRVYFELESRPPWAFSRVAYENEFWIEFPLRESMLASAAGELRADLRRFPQRE